ncbi:MAG: pilus assembly protein [Alphaproteobacteria bacterium]|nr:pilus assembly protein [Alphaproteobacteria bacterium]
MPVRLSSRPSGYLRRLRRLRRHRRGNVAVESAIVVTALVLLMLGITDLARYAMMRSSLQSAVQETARHAMVAVPKYTDKVCFWNQVEAEVEAMRPTLIGMLRERALAYEAGPVEVTISHSAGYLDRCTDLQLHIEAVGRFSFVIPGFPGNLAVRAYQSVAMRQNNYRALGERLFTDPQS